MLPTFIVIGAPKCGTTSLHRYLAAHPQVFMSEPKELDFFLKTHEAGGDIRWYEDRFAAAGDAVARGESSPRYTMHPYRRSEPARMAELLPGARLIYLVRHPVDRAVSHYAERWLVGIERRSIERALLEDPFYLAPGRYAFQLERYLAHYPRERILILRADDLRDRREETVRRVLRFIGVDEESIRLDLTTMHNRSAARLGTPAWVRAVRQFGPYLRVKDRIPARLRRAVTRTTLRPLPPGVRRLEPEVRRRLHAMVADDLDRFGTIAGEEIVGSWTGAMPDAREREG